MFNIIKNVINRGGFDLADILSKIDSLWAEGKLNNEQRAELIELSRGSASAKDSTDVMTKLTELELRIKALESKQNQTITNTAEYEAGKWYYAGDKCLYEGIEYTCIAPDDTVCVWSPKDYPAYWEAV